MAAFFVNFDGSVLTLALPAIAADFHASVPALADLGSVLSLGTLAGLPVAILADRQGRRRLLAMAVAGFSLVNLASAAAPSLPWLAAERTAAGALETIAGVIATVLVIEESQAAWRGLAVAGITIASGAGIGLTTVLYPFLAPHWRALYLLGGSGLIAAVVLARRLPESRTWAASAHERVPLALLLRPPWRRRLGIVAVSAALGAVFYEPANLLLALFGSRVLGFDPAMISAVVAVSGLVSIPAFLVGGRLSDRFGRRLPATALSIATTLLAAGTFAGGAAAYWAGNVSWSVVSSAATPVLGAWYGELFPTRARATAEAFGGAAGAVGAVAGLQAVAALQPRFGLGPSMSAVAVAGLLGAALLLALPETRGRPLPD